MGAHKNSRRGEYKSERGAVLLQTIIALTALLALSSFVIDFGTFWVGRRQAQNAADAAALAGAIARAFDEPSAAWPPAANSQTVASIDAVLARHVQFANVTRSAVKSWTCPAWAAGGVGGTNCVRVDVFQDGTNGSGRLPVFFGTLVGITDQGTKATATAQVLNGNASDCLRPFGVPDLWSEQNNPATPTEFNAWNTRNGSGYGDPIVPPDVYTAPSASSPGTGYTVSGYYGTQFTLKTGGGGNANPQQPGWYQPIDVPRSAGPIAGGDRYRDNIATCNGTAVAIGTQLPTETGNKAGPTQQGIADLIALDPNARWDATNKEIVNSCVNATPSCGSYSPRTITLALYDTADFQYRTTHNDWSGCPTGGSCVKVVNFLGFFVDSIDQQGNVTGYLVRAPGVFVSGAPTLGNNSSFLVQISLIS